LGVIVKLKCLTLSALFSVALEAQSSAQLVQFDMSRSNYHPFFACGINIGAAPPYSTPYSSPDGPYLVTANLGMPRGVRFAVGGNSADIESAACSPRLPRGGAVYHCSSVLVRDYRNLQNSYRIQCPDPRFL
jgi:hypothetical protein